MTSNNILVVLAIWGQLVSGLAFGGPRATQDALEWGSGWSPAPTSAPDAAHELVKRGLLQGRQFASTILVGADQTCGYLSGSAGAAYTCGAATSTCNLLPPSNSDGYGALACCASGVCYGRLFCMNSAQYAASSCDDVCEANTFTLKCTLPSAPFCNTAVWGDVRVRDMYCASISVSTVQTIYTTYSGQTIGGRFTQRVLEDDIISSSSTTRRSSSTTSRTTRAPSTTTDSTSDQSGTNPFDTNTLPEPSAAPKSSTPIGAIVGGVVGGLAVLAAIAFGIFFIRRRNRKDKTAAPTGTAGAVIDNHNSQPPPTYIPPQPEMDGSGAAKPGMTQTSGYFAPPLPAKGYSNASAYQQQQQQQQYNNNGEVAPPPPASEGTWEPRRESNISPISPQAGGSSMMGSPHQTGRESIVSSGYETYPPPPPANAVHEMSGSGHNTYEMPGSPIRRS